MEYILTVTKFNIVVIRIKTQDLEMILDLIRRYSPNGFNIEVEHHGERTGQRTK